MSVPSGTVTECTIAANAGAGIRGGDGVRINLSYVVDHPIGAGVELGRFGSVTGSFVGGNDRGMRLGWGCRVEQSTIAGNDKQGILAFGALRAERNDVFDNGDGVVLQKNDDDDGSGLLFQNRLFGNFARGIVFASRKNTALGNYFFGNGVDFEVFAPDNKIAPIQCDPLTAGPWDNWEQ